MIVFFCNALLNFYFKSGNWIDRMGAPYLRIRRLL